MTGTLKRIVKRTLPGLYRRLQQTRQHYALRRLGRRLRPVEEAVVGAQGLVVQSGPFRGMAYINRALGSMILPKLVGSYESELHGAIEMAIAKGFERVVNIGCGEGYYAVGLARRLPRARVWAFDTDGAARSACRKLAEQNGVAERVQIQGACGPEELRKLTVEPALVVCDCEGYELALLVPTNFSQPRACEIIVELHDAMDAKISETILARFAATHAAEAYEQTARDPRAYPGLHGLSAEHQLLAVDEFRSAGIRWAYLVPKQTGVAARPVKEPHDQ
ncbi:MAG: methyltransferase [Acidobacteria bacterium]|nr:methyltransferase [Acidobacteriota bacterium]